MARCLEILKRCQHADAALPYGFNWTRQFARLWEPDHPFDAGVVVRPAGRNTGFEYVSSGGHTADEEPEWPEQIGDTVVNGSITFTCQAMSMAGLADRIDTSEWACVDPEIVFESEETLDEAGLQRTAAVISGGVPGQTHDCVNSVTTTAGHDYVAIVRLQVQ